MAALPRELLRRVDSDYRRGQCAGVRLSAVENHLDARDETAVGTAGTLRDRVGAGQDQAITRDKEPGPARRRPGLAGEEMDLGSGVLTSVRDVVDQITQLMGGTERLPPAPADAPEPAPTRPGDVDYAFQKIGWRSSTSLARGLQLTIEKYRGQTNKPA